MKDFSSATVHAHRLGLLRDALKESGLDAALVPSSDPHLSEYLPAHWSAREWLTGFTGSAGTLVVTADFAGLWTDSRYWTQAEDELEGTGIDLMRANAGATPSYIAWLTQNLSEGSAVWADGMVISLQLARQLEQELWKSKIFLRTDGDLLESVWQNRPPLPDDPIYEHTARHALLRRSEKLSQLRSAMRERGAQWHFISTLDDIAWLFNLRGSDVDFNPVFVAHALIGLQQAQLFLNDDKVPAELRRELLVDGVQLRSYEEATEAMSGLGKEEGVLLDPRRISFGIWQSIPAEAKVVESINPTTLAKSRKSLAQLAHVRSVMEQDGAVLCEFFVWLEQQLREGKTITELDVGNQLLILRRKQPGFVSPSFDTIAGFNANGALPHYRATLDKHSCIEGNGLLLIDTGGQYLGGTTDITRTVPVGLPSSEQRRDFTLVLKSLLALSSAHFPRGMRAPMLDAIARAPLWAEGMDYGHGTGHGVGYFLNVHEGPQSISCHANPEPHTAMEEGMITSIEPAVYRPGCWGVRIENLVANRSARKTEFDDFLHFETLTLCPIDTRCIDSSLMRRDEIDWLNRYHVEVRERLSAHVHGEAKEWLMKRTQPV